MSDEASVASKVEEVDPSLQTPEDLLKMMTKPVGDMTDEELAKQVTWIRAMRKVKIARKVSGKSLLDIILNKITPETAKQVLAKLEEPKKEEVGGTP